MGFEPTISCVTGRRALQAAPRGRIVFRVAQVGLEPTASLVLSQGGLPIAYRAVLSLQYPEQESNLQTLGFKPSRSAGWRIWACRQWSRMESNHRFLHVTQVSSPLDHGTVLSGLTGSCTRIFGVRGRCLPVGR